MERLSENAYHTQITLVLTGDRQVMSDDRLCQSSKKNEIVFVASCGLPCHDVFVSTNPERGDL